MKPADAASANRAGFIVDLVSGIGLVRRLVWEIVRPDATARPGGHDQAGRRLRAISARSVPCGASMPIRTRSKG